MDNFFKFIDMLDESILVLYDKNFFYTNHHLLTSLGFTQNNRPVSLKQIIELNWLTYIKTLSVNDKSVIPLIKKNGEEKKYTTQLYPFNFEQSHYLCFLLKEIDDANVEFEAINWIIEQLPFPVIVFDNEDNIFRKNKEFESNLDLHIKHVADLKKWYAIEDELNFKNKQVYSFPSPNNDEQVLYLLQYRAKTSDTFLVGIFVNRRAPVKGQVTEDVKNAFIQSIQYLQQLNNSDGKFTHINWQEINDEISNLKQVYNQLEISDTVSVVQNLHQIDLQKTIINELEILKSNEEFRKNVKLRTDIKSKLAYFKGDYSIGLAAILSVIDKSTEEICKREVKNLTIETFDNDDKVYLKIYGHQRESEMDLLKQYNLTDVEMPSDQNSPLLESMKKFLEQLKETNIQFRLNRDTREDIDLTLIFSKK